MAYRLENLYSQNEEVKDLIDNNIVKVTIWNIKEENLAHLTPGTCCLVKKCV